MPSSKSAASEILRRRYARNENRRRSLEREKINEQISRTIVELRKEAGLTQEQLAEKVRTTQSVISRLEDADYEGHSLSMLNRIADALQKNVRLTIEPQDSNANTVRMAFREVLRKMRLANGYTIEDAASRLEITPAEVLLLEQNESYKPSPLLLHRISKLYELPQRRLAVLCGAIRDIPKDVQEQASRFAAMSESFARLSPKEKKELDLFVRFLRTET
jgi:transcriptional regulator with XRE-family HTH domain